MKNGRDESENLSLTYGVRDGIISHCGEVDDTLLRPRKEAIDLRCFQHAGQFQPFTWEGCVVKISDKIAYLGRDIEDAVRLNFLIRKGIWKIKGYWKTVWDGHSQHHSADAPVCVRYLPVQPSGRGNKNER